MQIETQGNSNEALKMYEKSVLKEEKIDRRVIE